MNSTRGWLKTLTSRTSQLIQTFQQAVFSDTMVTGASTLADQLSYAVVHGQDSRMAVDFASMPSRI